MGKEYLIDSNALIGFFNGSLPEKGKQLLLATTPKISIITQIELFSSKHTAAKELSKLKEFVTIAEVFLVDIDIALKTIELRLKYKIKLPDAIIAATALYFKLILITRNISDFDKIDGLKIINPYL